jgi:hypothetical protein
VHTRLVRQWMRIHAHTRVSLFSRDSHKNTVWRWYRKRRAWRIKRLLLEHLPSVLADVIIQQLGLAKNFLG